jgi:hypothetical protein
MKKKIDDELSATHDDPDPFERDLPLICWKALSSLNIGRFSTIHINKIRNLIKIASKKSMHEAYPVLCYAIQNLVIRHSSDEQATNFIKPFFMATILAAELCERMAYRTASSVSHSRDVGSDNTKDGVLIKVGERDSAIEFIKKWILNEADDYIKICDPYFGIQDLEWIRIISSVDSRLRIIVLTSKKQQSQDGLKSNYADEYSRHWRLHISDQSPPDTDIIVVGTESKGELPIHDRMLITKCSGIRVGTSLNSIGKTKESEISLLSPDAKHNWEQQADNLINRNRRESDGEKLLFSTFNL